MEVELREAAGHTPLSLYIDLQPETRGDLEVISRAAIAWSQAIREAALVIDPFTEVRVELINGTEGSINLNSVVRAIRGTLNDPVRLKAIALGIAAYFAAQAGGWVVGKGYDALWDMAKKQIGIDAVEQLTPAQRREVEDIVERISSAEPAKRKVAEVYTQLSKDRAIKGVGVSLIPDTRPPAIVPREEFAVRANGEETIEEIVTRRTITDRLLLSLVSPVLADGDYKWKFQLGTKPFWAIMADEDFRRRISPGSTSAPRMVAGIQMDVEIKTTQELRNGVWTNTLQEVTKVFNLREPPTQPSWLDAPTE